MIDIMEGVIMVYMESPLQQGPNQGDEEAPEQEGPNQGDDEDSE